MAELSNNLLKEIKVFFFYESIFRGFFLLPKNAEKLFLKFLKEDFFSDTALLENFNSTNSCHSFPVYEEIICTLIKIYDFVEY